jgi:hypothetical protein
MAVMLSPSIELRINSAKHLAFSVAYEDQILRLSPQDDIATQLRLRRGPSPAKLARVISLVSFGVIEKPAP